MKKQYLLSQCARAVLMVFLIFPFNAFSQSPQEPGFFSSQHLFSGSDISQDEAASIVLDKIGGRVLDVKLGEFEGRNIYLVKLLMEESRVQIIGVDQINGEIIR